MKPRFFQHVISTFGITVLQQFAGLGRQVLIAAYFGVSRQFDQYLVVYSLATITVFNISSVFDTVAISRLVKVRENNGEEAFWQSSNRLLLQALVGGLCFASGLLIAVRVLLPVVAAGFNDVDRKAVVSLTNYFVPWILIVVPHYAVSAHLKATWRFHWVFGAEVMAIVVSALTLWLNHGSINDLPLAYGVGYFCAFVALLWRRGFHRSGNAKRPIRLLPAMANQHLANQIGSVVGVVDRYFQSYLEVGGISALGYAGQIVNNLSSLMTFREIYVVPLSTEAGRDERMKRMLQGIVLISIPSVFFVVEFARPIVSVLFQRGNFTPEAANLTGDLLQILAVSIAVSSVLAPMARLFQILDRISYSHLMYFVSLLGTGALQYLLVFRLGWGAHGVAWAALGNSALLTVVVSVLVRRCGVMIDWRHVLSTAAFATGAALIAVAISWPIALQFSAIFALAISGTVFGLVIAASYFLARGRLRLIVG